MAHSPLLMGVDIGTTNIKALIFEPNGQIVAAASTPTPSHYPRPTWAHYEADELWTAAIATIGQAAAKLAKPQQVVSIGVSSFGETGFPLDRHARPIYPGIAWFDQRTHAQMRWLETHIGLDHLFETTGLPILPIYGLCKLLWLRDNEPDVLARTAHWLNAADYIAFKLTGVPATEFSLASRTLALDLHHRCWATNLLQAVGIDPHILAPLRPSGTSLGSIRPEVARQTGLSSRTVATVAGHDHVCAAFALGVTTPGVTTPGVTTPDSTTPGVNSRGKLLNSMGTSEAVFWPTDAALTDPAVGQQGYSQGLLAIQEQHYYYILGGLFTSGGSIEWLRELLVPLNQAEPLPAYERLIAEASEIPAGSLGVHFLPYLRLANPPHNDPKARGAFIGLTTDANQAVLFRAILEGLAYEVRLNMETLLTHVGGQQQPQIIATGGGTRNPLWMQIKASVQNQPLQMVEMAEAVTFGAALMGGLSAQVFADVTSALAAFQLSETEVSPDPEQAVLYEQFYQAVYQHFHPTIRQLHHRIYDLQER